MINHKKIYENKIIELWSTGQDYDFGWYIVNKTDEPLTITDQDGLFYDIIIKPKDWQGLLIEDSSYIIINNITNNKVDYL